MRREPREMITYLLVVVLPLATVKIYAHFSGKSVPVPASGAGVDPVHIQISSGNGSWSEQAVAAGKHAEALADEPFGPSPLFYREELLGPVVERPPEDDPPRMEPVPQFRVQVIWAGASDNLALINGKKYSSGDRFGDTGWVVTEIDIDSRSVRFEHPKTGRAVRASIDEG